MKYYDKKFEVRLSSQQKELVKATAIRQGITASRFIRDAIDEKINRS